jgi:hypothetical protein
MLAVQSGRSRADCLTLLGIRRADCRQMSRATGGSPRTHGWAHLLAIWGHFRSPCAVIRREYNSGWCRQLAGERESMANTLVVRTRELVASVSLPDWEPHHIARGGPVTVRAIERLSTPIVLRGRWCDECGLHDFDRAVQVDERLSSENLAALEALLHDEATVQIAISRVAREHRLTRSEAGSVLGLLVGRGGPSTYEAFAIRPECLRSWIDPDNPQRFVGASGWVFWWQDSAASVSFVAGGGRVDHHEGVDSMGEAVALAAGRIRCQCGEVTGTRCGHFRLRGEMIVVEWMPYHLRNHHCDARHQGTYPENGSLRLLCCVECGALLIENEEGWARLFRGES